MSDVFWSSTFGAIYQPLEADPVIEQAGIIQSTPGQDLTAYTDSNTNTTVLDGYNQPYFLLPGADDGIDSPALVAQTDQLFPVFDGVTAPPPAISTPPDGFTDSPGTLDPEDFLSWHSWWQMQYIANNKDSLASAANPWVTIGNSTDGTITAILLDGKTKAGVVEQMQKNDFARLSKVDQEAIAVLPAFAGTTSANGTAGLAFRLGLIPYVGATISYTGPTGTTVTPHVETPEEARQALADMATSYKSFMQGTSGTALTDEICKVFRDEIDNWAMGHTDTSVTPAKTYTGRLENSGIFSFTEFKKALDEILTRFKRVQTFAQSVTPTELLDTSADGDGNVISTSTGYYYNVSSLDSGAAVARGLAKFVEQERRILALDNAKLELVKDGKLKNKKLDVPNLIFLLQLNYNLMDEAKVTADTEEINQQNVLLQVYGQMQQMVNNAIKMFDATEQEEDRTINGTDSGDEKITAVTNANTKLLISMFDQTLATNGAGANGTIALHPIEKLRGIQRPLHEIIEPKDVEHLVILNNMVIPGTGGDEFKEWRRGQWDSYNTNLSNAVNLINQENQVKMNDINSLSKQKDRHFDLANGALSKMFDTIQSIARATGN
ncbi:hypothetical protein [Prosthecomicrobium hirschii]|uniref:hypothetical protein n=1 Tax=Prosthecodimorpha hirschii TaxID=665126 RepID=UPI0022201E6F|nr:hypothetical protein [Prosthecomicrobium hirschii]MCW1843511.1 hypothetical protein [Prosthecomicrobium hirschii]